MSPQCVFRIETSFQLFSRCVIHRLRNHWNPLGVSDLWHCNARDVCCPGQSRAIQYFKKAWTHQFMQKSDCKKYLGIGWQKEWTHKLTQKNGQVAAGPQSPERKREGQMLATIRRIHKLGPILINSLLVWCWAVCGCSRHGKDSGLEDFPVAVETSSDLQLNQVSMPTRLVQSRTRVRTNADPYICFPLKRTHPPHPRKFAHTMYMHACRHMWMPAYLITCLHANMLWHARTFISSLFHLNNTGPGLSLFSLNNTYICLLMCI